jgi:hypothetical protein
MVKLRKTGKSLNRKGDLVVVETPKGGHKVVERGEVSEVWIGANGSFDAQPMVLTGTREAARLPSAERKELLDEGYRLWKYDALGGTIVSMTTYFVLGRGVTFSFDDEQAQFYAKKFYKKNGLEIKLRSATDESVAFGDIFMWLRPHRSEVRRGSKAIWRIGDTQVTFVDPANIHSIESADEDPSDPHNYLYEYVDGGQMHHSLTIPDISKYDVENDSEGNGCMLHVKFNAGNMDPFGHSDLLRVKEWLDNYQEYLRDGVIINKLYRSPCFDISIADGTPDEVNAAIARYGSWTIGSNPVHTDREVWQVLEFTGPNTSSENSRRSLLLIIAAGVGFAEYMLADGANANLASSKSQQLPVIKKFEDRQDILAFYLMKVFQFALETKAKIATNSGLTIETDQEGDMVPFEGHVKFPTIAEERDVEVAQTNQVALEAHYMSPRTAAGRLGLDYGREVEIMLKDKQFFDKLKEAGIISDPTEDAIKLERAKAEAMGSGDDRGGSQNGRPNNQNGRQTDVAVTTQ